MRNMWVQLLLLVASFFLLWFVLSKVEWVDVLRIKKVSKQTDQKLGEVFWEVFKRKEKEVKEPHLIQPVDSLLQHVMVRNNIDTSDIHLHLVHNSEVNAFALPGGHLVVFTGLISASQNETELCGVLGHELAHIQNSHVTRKLVKEVGLSLLISMAGGNAGTEVIRETVRMLSSTAYDRELEKEADLASADYLINADVDPKPFAHFLSRLGKDHEQLPAILVWASTHPDPAERADYLTSYIDAKEITSAPVLHPKTWQILQDSLQTNEAE